MSIDAEGTMQLKMDSLIDEFRHIVPELRFAGGSFAHWLPHPRDVPPADHNRVLMATQEAATSKCLEDLVARVGFPAVAPPRLASGGREWPAGYIGSVSHKGTTVAAAITSTDHMKSVGIDVEKRDEKGIPAIHGLDAAEQPWSVPGAEGRVILFSVKEAVYKALHPILGQELHFSEVAVSWARTGPVRSCGVALACGVALDVRCSIAVPSCVLSAALWPVTATPDLTPPHKPGLPVSSPPE